MSVTRLFVMALVMGFCGSTLLAAPAEPNEPNKPGQRMRGQNRDPQAMVEQRLKELTTALDLKENQQKAIKPILENQAKQI